MTAEMDLSDLNIVAIAPTSKPRSLKKKKNNKYERRRQSAQKARNGPSADASPDVKPQQGINATKDESTRKSPPRSLDNGEKTAVVKDAVADVSQKTVGTPNDKTLPTISKEVSEKKESAENPKTETVTKPTTQSTKPQNDIKSNSKTDETDSTNQEVVEVETKSPSGRRKTTTSNDTGLDDEAHAKYMANFHARPKELDRRSGAKKSSDVISKYSSHLFVAKNWESLNVHSRLLQTLTTHFKLSKPTTIQSRAIQSFQQKENSNILIQSETGSGKTLAYLLPILQILGFDKDGNSKKQPRKEFGTRCIILCPTRELASQTLEVLERLCQLNFAGWLVPGALLGGDSRNSEKSRLRKGVGIVVATPGRLLDHLNKTESLLMSMKGKVQWLVLDEADRLLDMGLGAQVKQIVQIVRANEASKSQPWWRSVLVSATVTPSVEALAKERMLCGTQKWIWVKGGTKEETDALKKETADEDTEAGEEEGFSESTPRQLAQFHLTMTAKLRLCTLVSFLAQRVKKQERTVVFFATCASVDYHYELFSAMASMFGGHDNDDDNDDGRNMGLFGDNAGLFKLHGSVAHNKRIHTLKRFDASTKSAILLTTDVAARGLNLPGVDWAVQYDPPCEISDYVHRVGRVARAGKAGHSVLFLLPSERAYLDVLETKGVSNITPMPLAEVLNRSAELCPEWTNAGLKYGGAKEQKELRGSRLGEYFTSELQRQLEDCVVQDDQEARRLHKEKEKEQKKEGKKRKRSDRFKEGKLMEMARAAFMSSLRAYSTKKEAAVRSIFSTRALHLGHVARSFALKEPPKALVSKQKHTVAKNAVVDDIEKPRSMEFSKLDENLVRHSFSDNEDNDGAAPAAKRFKSKKGGKQKNSRAQLLDNAMKMQNNLMGAM
jgi:ATP-dependent RNA helicase DDX31/DBP7